MKSFLNFLLVLVLGFTSIQAQQHKLQTIENNYSAALKKAKKENKLLLVCVWGITCSTYELGNTLKNDTVINMLNKHFVTAMIDYDYDTNKAFLDKYGKKVSLYFIEPKTEVVRHKYHGDLNVKSFLFNSRWVLDTKLSYRYVVEKYEREITASTDKAFMLHFLKLMRYADELKNDHIEQYRKLIKNAKPSYEDMCFIYDFFYYETNKGYEHHYPFSLQDIEFKMLFEHPSNFCQYFDSTQIKCRIKIILDKEEKELIKQIVDNSDTILLKKYQSYLYEFSAIENIPLFDSEGQVLYYWGTPREDSTALECLKILMLKNTDSIKYNQYAKQFLHKNWNEEKQLYTWAYYWNMAEFDKNNATMYEDVLLHILELDCPPSSYLSTTIKLAELYYEQQKLEKSREYLKMAQQKEVELFDKGGGILFPECEAKIRELEIMVNGREWSVFEH